jgi:crossover junction endodeoxyribonuclease RuvC
MLILGIDPGVSGALALLGRDGLIAVEDMPVEAGEVSCAQLAALLRDWARTFGAPVLAVVERQSTRPGQGVSSSGKLMMRYGLALGVVACLGYPLSSPTPAQWKRGMGVGKDKDAARARASELWPGDAGRWRRVRDHGRAEACLIAAWGARQ